MIFDVAGPFTIQRHGKKRIITDASREDLKSQLEAWENDLSEACGCYVFAIRAGKGFTPYYVGQACKTSIFKESMNSHNREKYNRALNDSSGTPVLFLLPMRTPTTGNFRKVSKSDGRIPALNFLERWLIATAIDKNPELLNNKETMFLREIRVKGLLNAEQGESTKDAQLLKQVLW